MRKMYTFVVILSLLLLVGCQAPDTPKIIEERLSLHAELPSGVWYRSDAEAWDAEHLPQALMGVFFGKETPDYPWVLFLGTDDDVLAEVLYAVCHTELEAQELAKVLSLRLAFLKESFADIYPASLAESAVIRRGKSVFYTAAPQSAFILDLVK